MIVNVGAVASLRKGGGRANTEDGVDLWPRQRTAVVCAVLPKRCGQKRKRSSGELYFVAAREALAQYAVINHRTGEHNARRAVSAIVINSSSTVVVAAAINNGRCRHSCTCSRRTFRVHVVAESAQDSPWRFGAVAFKEEAVEVDPSS